MVVKIMRHDAEDKVKREAEVFSAAAEKIGQGMLKTWQGQLAQYMTEFDFRNEANNVNIGAPLYDIEDNDEHPYKAIAPNVRSMKVSTLVPPAKDVLVCTLAEGDTADSCFKEMRTMIQRSLDPIFERDQVTGRLKWDPQTKKPIFKTPIGSGMLHDARLFCDGEYDRILDSQRRLQQAASVWFSEALLGSGKFHGDVHAGNLMLSYMGGHVTFIDFGNLYELKTHYEKDNEGNIVMETVTRLTENGMVQEQRPKVKLDERVQLLQLIIGATLRDKTFFLRGFESLLSGEGKAAFNAEGTKAKAEAILDSILAKGQFSFDVCYRLQGALSELQKLGLELPPQINCFVLSMTRMQNTIAEMNTILNQTLAVIDVLKEVPPAEKILPDDPLDIFGNLMHYAQTPAGRPIVDIENPAYDPNAPEDDEDRIQYFKMPAFVEKMMEYSEVDRDVNPLFKRDGEYQTALRESIANAPDKIAQVRHICGLFTRHLDPKNMEQVIDNVNTIASKFETSWKAAKGDVGKEAAVDAFMDDFVGGIRAQISSEVSSYKLIFNKKYDPPSTFAKVVMGVLFNGADAANKIFNDNFSTVYKVKLGADAAKIATDELHVSAASLAKATLLPAFMYKGPSADEIVMNAIAEDTKNMGGDKSYQIDIGV